MINFQLLSHWILWKLPHLVTPKCELDLCCGNTKNNNDLMQTNWIKSRCKGEKKVVKIVFSLYFTPNKLNAPYFTPNYIQKSNWIICQLNSKCIAVVKNKSETWFFFLCRLQRRKKNLCQTIEFEASLHKVKLHEAKKFQMWLHSTEQRVIDDYIELSHK